MDSVDEISKMFQTESEKLDSLFNDATTKSELSIHEIIETYYQVMNISSMITMLQQQITPEHKSFLDILQNTETEISEKFNHTIHPQIIKQLDESIKNITKSLQSVHGEKSKQDVEAEAKIYEELRKTMSTKEFVEQYANGLSDD